MDNFSDYSYWRFKQRTTGHRIGNTTPIDDRLVFQTKAEALFSTTGRRYPELRIYIMGEEKEYWFKSGVADENLIDYNPWSGDISTGVSNAINQLKTDKPWLADISGGGSGSGSSATTFVISGTEHTRDEIPAYLNEQITSPSTGQEVNVVFREDDVETFMKFIYIR